MKIGDLVTVSPAGVGIYLIVGEDTEREDNKTSAFNKRPMGRLFQLYRPSHNDIQPMHEKWIEVL